MTFCSLLSILQLPGQVPSVQIRASVLEKSSRHSLKSCPQICLADLLHLLSVPSCSHYCSVFVPVLFLVAAVTLGKDLLSFQTCAFSGTKKLRPQ